MDPSKPELGVSARAVRGTIEGTRLGHVVEVDASGRLKVDVPGNPSVTAWARRCFRADPEELLNAVRDRQQVVLAFENGDPTLPIALGLVQTETPQLDAALEKALSEETREALVDGERVTIEGREEVVLRCGKASLTLRRDGKVVLRGVNIQSEAEERQRIKGSMVQIN